MGTIEGDDGWYFGIAILIGPSERYIGCSDISHLVIWATGREATALAFANAIKE